jgi:YidC/Oxa1 family membrane protein insertase
MSLWNILLKQPLANLLFFFYQALGNNFGLAIIATAVAVGLAMIPLMLPSLKSAQKMQEIKPQLDKLAKKYQNDKQVLATKQLELYQQYKINPTSGFLPMILRLMVVIALYGVLRLVIEQNGSLLEINQLLYSFIKLPSETQLNTRFLYLDVLSPDTLALPQQINLGFLKISSLPGVFLLGSAVLQYLQSNILRQSRGQQPKAKEKSPKNSQKTTEQEMAETMQKQMTLMMPVMTILIGYKLASGLVLSWFTFSLIAVLQQLYTQNINKKTKDEAKRQ